MDELLDRAPCGFVSFADDGRIAAVNATLCERLGWTRDELLGRHVEMLLTTAGRMFFQTHLFPLVRMQGAAPEIFLLLRTRAGEEVGVLCNAVRHPRGGTPMHDWVLLEVRERRRYEDALLAAKRAAEEANERLEQQTLELELQQHQLEEQTMELELQAEALAKANEELIIRGEELERQRVAADEANRAKSTFLAVMSHELRTPLNAIGGYVQLLQMGVHGAISDEQRETLGRIDRSQRHLLRLINDVLNLSRIEAGRVEYHIEDLSLAELVASVLPMVEPQIAARQLHCEVRAAPEAVARADREKVQQILLNLLTNATKFTGPGGRIRVDAGRAEEPEGAVLLRVTDSGIGIPAEMRDRVFEPFVQVDASHTRAAEGTGLGLAISRDLARGMGGELSLESEFGVGSSFVLSLPAADENASPVPRLEANRSAMERRPHAEEA